MTPSETPELLTALSGPAMGLCPGCGCIQAEGYVDGWFGWICGSQSLSQIREKIRFKQSNACASMHWRLRAEKAEARLRELDSQNTPVIESASLASTNGYSACRMCLAHHDPEESCPCYLCGVGMHGLFIRCAIVDNKPVALCPNCDDSRTPPAKHPALR